MRSGFWPTLMNSTRGSELAYLLTTITFCYKQKTHTFSPKSIFAFENKSRNTHVFLGNHKQIPIFKFAM